MKKKLSILALVLVILMVSIIGCAAGSVKNEDYSDQYAMAEPTAVSYDDEEVVEAEYYSDAMKEKKQEASMAPPPSSLSGSGSVTGESGSDTPYVSPSVTMEQKLIYTTYLSFETTEYNDDTSKIPTLVQKYNGYMQNSSIQGNSIDQTYNNRYASFTVRIPSEKAGAFEAELLGTFHVVNTSKQALDITQEYYNTESQLKSLEARLVKLEGYLDEAEDLEVMLRLESEISSTQQQITYTKQSLDYMKNQVSYDTFEINFNEVLKHTNPVLNNSFSERISAAFSGSFENFVGGIQNFAIWVVGALPSLLILLVFIIIVVIVAKAKRGKKTASLSKEKEGKTNSEKKEDAK